MRTFFVERVYKPQIVMVCPKGEMFRFDQRPKQIEFSRPHLKTMALDAAGKRIPRLPAGLHAAGRLPDAGGVPARGLGLHVRVAPPASPTGRWVDTGRPDEDVKAAPIVKKEAPAFHDETSRFPSAMEMATGGDLKTKLYAAMAQTDCTACGYDCEGYAAALAAEAEKDPNLCVPGKEETAKVVKDLLKGNGSSAANA